MTPSQAQAIVQRVLDPLPLEQFFEALGRKCLAVPGSPDHPRAGLFGADPQAIVLNAFGSHAATLDCHGVAPSLPPPDAERVPSAAAFATLIRTFHERDYTVRVPEVVDLSPELQTFARALELLLQQPVSASMFWSKAGAGAIVHYDRQDNIIVQLSGTKRWFISRDPPGLQNNWKHLAEPVPRLERHQVVDVGPGDLLYIPRGTPHTVASTTESLHLAILFTPITLREAIIAALDHYSDLDRTFRETAFTPGMSKEDQALSSALADGIGRLMAQCRSPDFVQRALQQRAARIIGDLPALPRPSDAQPVSPSSRVRHSRLAVCHLSNLGQIVNFSQPGEHIAVHNGAEPALRYAADHPSFRVGDLPGLSDDVRVALIQRLIASGFLELED